MAKFNRLTQYDIESFIFEECDWGAIVPSDLDDLSYYVKYSYDGRYYHYFSIDDVDWSHNKWIKDFVIDSGSDTGFKWRKGKWSTVELNTYRNKAIGYHGGEIGGYTDSDYCDQCYYQEHRDPISSHNAHDDIVTVVDISKLDAMKLDDGALLVSIDVNMANHKSKHKWLVDELDLFAGNELRIIDISRLVTRIDLCFKCSKKSQCTFYAYNAIKHFHINEIEWARVYIEHHSKSIKYRQGKWSYNIS